MDGRRHHYSTESVAAAGVMLTQTVWILFRSIGIKSVSSPTARALMR